MDGARRFYPSKRAREPALEAAARRCEAAREGAGACADRKHASRMPSARPYVGLSGDERSARGAGRRRCRFANGVRARAGVWRASDAQATATGVGGHDVPGRRQERRHAMSSRRHRYVITMTSRSRARRVLEARQKACESAAKARVVWFSRCTGRGCECHEGCSSVVPFQSRQAQSRAAGRQLQRRRGRCVPPRHRRRVINANEILCPCVLPLSIRRPCSTCHACPAARTPWRPLS